MTSGRLSNSGFLLIGRGSNADPLACLCKRRALISHHPDRPVQRAVASTPRRHGPVGSLVSSPAEEVRYITRQERLLGGARARGVFQLTFYDLDLSGFPPQPPGALHAKPALAVWDRIFRRPLTDVLKR
jgi:hypothetical protein